MAREKGGEDTPNETFFFDNEEGEEEGAEGEVNGEREGEEEEDPEAARGGK